LKNKWKRNSLADTKSNRNRDEEISKTKNNNDNDKFKQTETKALGRTLRQINEQTAECSVSVA